MKKRLLLDRPTLQDRGQYTFFDDDGVNHEDSNGIPRDFDKFSKQELYSTAIGDNLNEKIIENGLKYISVSNFKINTLRIENNNVSGEIKNIDIRAYLFDNFSYQYYSQEGNGGVVYGDYPNTGDPTDYEYDYLSPLDSNEFSFGFPEILKANAAIDTMNQWRFFDADSWGTKDEGWSPGNLLDDDIIMDDINNDFEDGGEYIEGNNWSYDDRSFDANVSFRGRLESGEPGLFSYGAPQTIYLAIWMRGDRKKWYGTDKRKKRIQIFEFNVIDFFDENGDGTLYESEVLKYSDSYRVEGGGGGGGSEKPAFKCTELQISVDTRGFTNYPPETTFSQEITQLTGSVTPPKVLDLLDLDNTFFTQDPSREILNNSIPNNTDTELQSNFEPVPFVTVNDRPTYDLQAYQASSLDRQICSAPTEVALDFTICDYNNVDSNLTEKAQLPDNLGFKFFVLNWDDKDDEIKDVEDFVNYTPTNIKELLEFREQNLFYFSDIGTPLMHQYSTPGIKTIKSVLFSHTIEDFTQIVRWKFLKTRLFLDIPLNQVPDFGQLGGDEYTTIPWPYTTPIIGGTDLGSKYQTTLRNTLSGGKIGDTDIIDQRFLVDAIENDELGQSILDFDLEQLRFFNSGEFSMAKLLGIDNTPTWFPHTDTTFWDGDTNSFSSETSVEKIFINDSLDQNLVDKCKLEINTGEVSDNSIYDSTGNSNKGLLIGDYKINKRKKGTPMFRNSSIKLPKKSNKKDGAL